MTEGQGRTGIEILDRIVATKREELVALAGKEGELASKASAAMPPKDVIERIRTSGGIGVFAEVKRKSPGAGTINAALDPDTLSRDYEEGGAVAVSVLTDETYFGGSLQDLVRLRGQRTLPLLRKDFVLDRRQVLEARGAGADIVLLIVRILSDPELLSLREEVEALGMTALVEAHDQEELDRALESGASLIGINSRDLNTFTTDLGVIERLAPQVPADVTLVAESGLHTVADVRRVAEAGANAILVGEALVRHNDPAQAVREFSAVPQAPRN